MEKIAYREKVLDFWQSSIPAYHTVGKRAKMLSIRVLHSCSSASSVIVETYSGLITRRPVFVETYSGLLTRRPVFLKTHFDLNTRRSVVLETYFGLITRRPVFLETCFGLTKTCLVMLALLLGHRSV